MSDRDRAQVPAENKTPPADLTPAVKAFVYLRDYNLDAKPVRVRPEVSAGEHNTTW